MTNPTEPLLDTVTLVADQQVMSDEPGDILWEGNLIRAKANGDIRDFRVLGAWEGAWGLQHVTFTVDVPLDGRRFRPDHTHEEVKQVGEAFLCDLAGDSDVFVRCVSKAFMGQPTVPSAAQDLLETTRQQVTG